MEKNSSYIEQKRTLWYNQNKAINKNLKENQKRVLNENWERNYLKQYQNN